MKKIMLIALLVSLVSFGLAQTVTVSKSGTPDYNTVQAAIDYFAQTLSQPFLTLSILLIQVYMMK